MQRIDESMVGLLTVETGSVLQSERLGITIIVTAVIRAPASGYVDTEEAYRFEYIKRPSNTIMQEYNDRILTFQGHTLLRKSSLSVYDFKSIGKMTDRDPYYYNPMNRKYER